MGGGPQESQENHELGQIENATNVESSDSMNVDKPGDNKPEDNKLVDNKPEENKPEENKPEENKPEENKPEENKPEDKSGAIKPEDNNEQTNLEKGSQAAPVTEGAAVDTQQAIEERAKFEKNLEYEESIKKEEAGKTPLVCIGEDIEMLYKEYEQGSDVYRNKILKLADKHHKIRRCRGDGNCFYRAFGFAWFERLMVSKNQTLRQAALKSLVDSKSILKSAGYDPLVFEDIYDVVEEKMKAVVNGEYDDPILLTIFQTDEISNRIVWYLRLITAAYLKVHREEYEPFLEFEFEMDQYCRKYVEVMDQEADHIHVISLTKALQVPVEVAYMSGSNAMDQVNFHEFYPEEAQKGDITLKPLVLLYRPGHYDILYRRE